MRQTLNFKIYQDLYNKIRSHFYKPGEQLPTESALAERYSTSLSPIRQALGKLESEQLIVRMPGKGTFVSSSLPWENMLLMSGFGVHFIDKKVDSDSVHCQTLKCCKKAMDEQQCSVFKTDPAKLFTYVARVRYVDGKPYLKPTRQNFLHMLPACVMSTENRYFSLTIILKTRSRKK